MPQYKGFSTKNYGICDGHGNTNVSFVLKDVDLVKQDLLNHILTLKGERVMQPSFGTIIPSLLFEPFDESTISVVEDELTRVINDDPRVSLISLNLIPDIEQHKITASIVLEYVELNLVESFDLNIQFE